jgi:PAS domain S-box-containing protein
MAVQIPVRHRERVVLALIAAVVLGLGVVVARHLRQAAENATVLYGRLASGLDLIDDLQFNIQETRRTLLYALHTSDANRQLAYAEQSRAAETIVDERLSDRSALTSAPAAAAQITRLRQAWRRYLAVRDEVIGLILEGSFQEGVALDEQLGAVRFNEVRDAIATLKQGFESDAATRAAEMQRHADSATRQLSVLVVSGLAAALVGVYLVNRRAAVEGMLRVEAHKGSILQAVPNPIISTDADGRIIELNEAAERTFGVRRSEVLGAPVDATILAPAASGTISRRLGEHGSADAAIARAEIIGKRRDGTEFPMEMAVATHSAGGEEISTFHLTDTTGRKWAEEQLRRAKTDAEVATRAKSDFLATMSHELRTPLTGVVGIAELLQAAEHPAQRRHLTRMLKSSATALLSLVSDILDYSRIEAGLVQLVPVSFSLQACFEDALDPVTEAATRKGLEIGCVIEPTVPHAVIADRDRVRQVMLNLLSNAVKFTDHGEVAVRVGARPVADSMVVITVAVRDTGVGIDRQSQTRLFHHFSQVDGTSTRRHGGAGLGLAISERLSRQLGGSLSVESTPGKGSTFTFEFVASLVQDPPAADRPAEPLAGLRVLGLLMPGIVQAQVASLLACWGVDLVVTDEVEAATVDPDFDVILVDADASDGRLYRAAKTHTIEGLQRTPVIVLAREGLATPDADRSAWEAVLKPVRSGALAAALATAAGISVDAEIDATTIPSAQFSADSLSILLVEDNAPNRCVVQMMLAELGLRADEASGGLEAVARARERDYDLILMDMQMPIVDGLEATRRIRAEQRAARPMVLALTANVMSGDDERCRAAGMDGYLAKPLQMNALAEALSPLVRDRSPAKS